MTSNSRYPPICTLRSANVKFLELTSWELVKIGFYCQQRNCSSGTQVLDDIRFVRMLRGIPGDVELYKHVVAITETTDQLTTRAISAIAKLLVVHVSVATDRR